MTKWCAVLLPLLLLCGCLDVEDHLSLNADGSGTIHLEVKSDVPAEFFEGMSGMVSRGGSRGVMYPPISESEAKKFFPADAFTLVTKQEELKQGGTKVVIDAKFKDINALLTSPYGSAHLLHVSTNNGKLLLKARTGMTIPVRISESKEATSYAAAIPSAASAKTNRNNMRFEFRLTLPNAAGTGNGVNEGNTTRWTMERAKSNDVEAFIGQLETVMEASCDAHNLTMEPATPPRLGLLPFKDLVAGSLNTKRTTVDTNQVQQTAKFMPYALHINRSVDLSGEGSSYENEGQLLGAVIVPVALVPQKWGNVELLEAVDNAGNNLKSEDSDRSWSSRNWDFRQDFEDDAEEPKPKTEERHMVKITFEPPDWQAKEIARIKAILPLQYFSGAQLVKISNAIPAKWIVDTSKGNYSYDGSEKLVAAPELTQLGVKLSVQSAMTQGPMTMLTFEVEGDSAVSEFQVFDADGLPWPTMNAGAFFGTDSSRQLVIYGQPKAPLSLALLVNDQGTTVNVPLVMENIPLQKSVPASKGETK